MNEEQKRQIEDYLMNRMAKPEKQAFRQQIENNPMLQEEVTLQAEIIKGIEVYGDQQLKARLRQLRAEQVQQKPVRQLFTVYRAIAAAVLILVAALAWIFLQPQAEEDLYSSYFTPYAISLSERGAAETSLQRIEANYFAGNYQAVIAEAEGLSDLNVQPELMLALAISYLETGQSGQARNTLQPLQTTEFARYQDHAIWYTALSYLKDGQLEDAQQELQRLAADPAADHHREAVQILESLQ